MPITSKRRVADLAATFNMHYDIVPHLLSMHTLTGCDTVSAMHGIDKVKALYTLNKEQKPPPIGDHQTKQTLWHYVPSRIQCLANDNWAQTS